MIGPATHPSGVRRCAVVVLAILVVSTGWAQNERTAAPQTRKPDSALAHVNGVQRLPDKDVVFLRSGERLQGSVHNASMTLHSPYGALELQTRFLAAIEMDVGSNHFDRVKSIHRNLMLGWLYDQVEFVDESGGRSTLAKIDIRQIVFAVRAQEKSPRSGSFVVLVSGELISGRIADWKLFETSPSRAGQLSMAQDQVEWIRFLNGASSARVLSRDGREIDGVFTGRVLKLSLDLGPEIEIPLPHVRTVYARPGFLPQPVRQHFPTDAASGLADAIQPPGETPEAMVWISPGNVVMGSPPEEPGRGSDEDPQTQVIISHGFWMGKHEVTQGEFEAVMGTNPSGFPGDSTRPVEKVTWREARDYCRRLTGRRAAAGLLPVDYEFRLPTEAEWEYACRAGTADRFCFGDDPDDSELSEYAWFLGNSGSSTHSVAKLKPNRWGLHDMHGNVWEWCLDLWHDAYPGGTVTDYSGPADGWLRVARGGSWLYDASFCRSANRDNYGPDNRCSDIGFRVVLARGLE